MTAPQPPSRTRSLRSTANGTAARNATQTQSQPASGPNAAQVSHARSQTAALTAGGGTAALHSFLTNLKLLDLDLLPDWPGISAETFAATGSSAQGQKKRVRSVEWALFQLFSLWDAEEATAKLKPYFPPHDQVQSVSLRSALLRALEQAKKDGALGRDAIIRKTMLDECRGERLEEVLAVFSSAVLKRVIAEDMATDGEHPTLAARLALENRGYRGEKDDLTMLILAHRASLRQKLQKKQGAASRYRDFSDLLGVKERGVRRRIEELQERITEEQTPQVSRDAVSHMHRLVRNNWTGNERWMDTLLCGDTSDESNGPFGMHFDRLWRRVEQGRLAEVEEDSSGLLEQLERRVRLHRERLDKWQDFRQRLHRGAAPVSVSVSPSKQKEAPKQKENRGIDFGFTAHQNLQIGRMSPVKSLGQSQWKCDNEYDRLLCDLKEELASTSSPGMNPLDFLSERSARKRRVGREYIDTAQDLDEAMSELSDLEEEDKQPVPTQQSPPVATPEGPFVEARRLPVRPKLSHDERPPPPPPPPPPPAASRQRLAVAREPSQPNVDVREPAKVAPPQQPKQHHFTPRREEMETPPSPTQHMADQILASMSNASPSPVKPAKPRHTLSLAERTRMSMARGSSFLSDEEPDLASPPPPPPPPQAPPPSAHASVVTTTVPVNDVDDGPSDLVSRTRRSMAGFEKAQQKAQLDRRRSLRRSKAMPPRREGSYFGAVDEEDAQEQSALAEELMGEEDMEAVFKARPKIKASPLPSPTREWE